MTSPFRVTQLIVPRDLALQGDPGFLDGHLDGVARHRDVPTQTIHGRRGDDIVVALEVEGQAHLDLLGDALNALDESRRGFGSVLFGERPDVPGQGNDAMIRGDADVGGVDARLPVQLREDGLLQNFIVRHGTLQCVGIDDVRCGSSRLAWRIDGAGRDDFAASGITYDGSFGARQ